jgi:hypothetical protein
MKRGPVAERRRLHAAIWVIRILAAVFLAFVLFAAAVVITAVYVLAFAGPVSPR